MSLPLTHDAAGVYGLTAGIGLSVKFSDYRPDQSIEAVGHDSQTDQKTARTQYQQNKSHRWVERRRKHIRLYSSKICAKSSFAVFTWVWLRCEEWPLTLLWQNRFPATFSWRTLRSKEER